MSHFRPVETFLRKALRRFGLQPLLRESIDRAKRAWKMGYDAENRCQSRRACHFQDVPGQRMEREQWMRGFAHSARDREPDDGSGEAEFRSDREHEARVAEHEQLLDWEDSRGVMRG